MNPICGTCFTEMSCKKNGVTVAPQQIPHHQYKGDMYQCKNCGSKVVIGFGNAFYEPTLSADILIA